jgi:hypothetical protein
MLSYLVELLANILWIVPSRTNLNRDSPDNPRTVEFLRISGVLASRVRCLDDCLLHWHPERMQRRLIWLFSLAFERTPPVGCP